MSKVDKVFFNNASMKQLGWDRTWFNCDVDCTDEDLIEAIKEFQTDHQLEVDGMCGPFTFRRIYTYREALEAQALRQLGESTEEEKEEEERYIICNGEKVAIDWENVINIEHPDAFVLPPSTYNTRTKLRDVHQFVCHWDAALSSKSCYDILKRRGLSVQFSIDNDGTIYQFTDANHLCWHAPPVNGVSVGVEITNAVERQYQGHYIREGFEKRPVVTPQKINGKHYSKILGFYPVQLEALKALIRALQTFYDIPSETPNADGQHMKKVKDRQNYRGIVHHYQVAEISSGKWDCAGLDLHKIIKEL